MTLNKKRTIILIINLLALFFVTRLCDFEDKTFSYGHAVSNIKEQAKRVKLPKIKAYKKKSKKEVNWVNIGSFRITHYGMDITTATATGATPTIGRTIGVDPNVIPYGTQVMINGHVYIAEDTGAYTGNHIDVLCESEAYSAELGTYTTDVYIKNERSE